MPHKRNPELSERVCGLARVVRTNALASLENVALWHERDISHSSAERVIFPDSLLALDYILDLFTGIMRGLVVYPENMRRNLDLTQGVIFSQKVMLAQNIGKLSLILRQPGENEPKTARRVNESDLGIAEVQLAPAPVVAAAPRPTTNTATVEIVRGLKGEKYDVVRTP